MESQCGILPIFFINSYFRETEKKAIAGQFVWGATPLKRYQRRPMFNSSWSETNWRVQKHKLNWCYSS